MANRDQDCYVAIETTLEALGVFGIVKYGFPIDALLSGADQSAVCSIMPQAWTENDEYDPIELCRSVVGVITLACRSEEPFDRLELLGQLEAQVCDAINGQSIHDLTLPAWTRVKSGVYPPAVHPEQRVQLRLEFSYFIDGYAGHDTSDD
jgi:hypothetical protein